MSETTTHDALEAAPLEEAMTDALAESSAAAEAEVDAPAEDEGPILDAQAVTPEAPWTFTMELTDTAIDTHGSITISLVVAGIDPARCTYNYVWSYEDLWEEGFWDSTVNRTGGAITDSSWEFHPRWAGTYHLYADVIDDKGIKKTTGQLVTVSFSARRNATLATAEPSIVVDDVSMIFNIASEQFNSLKEYFIALSKGELVFKEFRALDHINFTVRRGEAFGLVGTNGSGKSTMLKIIAGVLDASEGSCEVRGTIAPLIELGAGFDMELTARENIYLNGALLGYRREFLDEHFDDIVEFAELKDFMEMPLKNYSSGMVARIAFAIATVAEPDVLIVDETLSVGDFLFQKKCERRIRELIESDNVTVLLVSHDIELVERICDRVCWIEKGHQRMLGTTGEVCEAYKKLGA